MTDFSARLRLARIVNGLSVKDAVVLLKRAGLNISEKTLYNWEAGFRTPDADAFMIICEVYGVKTFEQFESLDTQHGQDEAELIRKYRALSEEAKARILNALDFEYQLAIKK